MKLREFLDPLYDEYHDSRFLSSDPLEFVHQFSDPWDQEAVALLCALLAYGKVKQIRASARRALDLMNQMADGPADFTRRLRSSKSKESAYLKFSSFVHRFNKGQDLILLFTQLERSWNRYGSLGAHFNSHLSERDPHIEQALTLFIQDWKTTARGPGDLKFLLNSPADGSCCKRWCMLLKWMGRKDKLDLGLWTQNSPLRDTFSHATVRPDQLILPLDTHVSRLSQYLGLTQRKTFGWTAALEITAELKKLSPNDPTRYDFALSRLGILDLCKKAYRPEICVRCQLFPVCGYAQKRAE